MATFAEGACALGALESLSGVKVVARTAGHELTLPGKAIHVSRAEHLVILGADLGPRVLENGLGRDPPVWALVEELAQEVSSWS